MSLYRNRAHAGQQLAERLAYLAAENAVVLGLPRGGLPVAFEIAKKLRAPLDVFLVRKLGAPGHEELAMGAIASGGVRVLNEDVISQLAISTETIARVAAQEQLELERRERLYRGGRPVKHLQDKRVFLVDDGLATGATMRAAILAVGAFSPSEIIVAVPTAPPEVCQYLAAEVTTIICLATPQPFWGVGAWYDDFSQVSDQEVRRLLDASIGFGAHAPNHKEEQNERPADSGKKWYGGGQTTLDKRSGK